MSPRYARPTGGEDMADFTQAFGNQVRIRIIGYLREHGPTTSGDIASALDVSPATVRSTLPLLIRVGVLETDPAQPGPGQRVLYSANEQTVKSLWTQLGRAIGEL